MKNNISTKVALAGLVVTGCTSLKVEKAKAEEIHCTGVSTKWVNDCAANNHKCSMAARTNFDQNEWLKLTSQDCQTVKEALKSPAIRSYIERIQAGTVKAVKRGKKF